MLLAAAIMAAIAAVTGGVAHAAHDDPTMPHWLQPGMFAVADTNNHRIQVFHPDGTFAFAFGSYGGGPGEFDSPVDVTIGPDGRIAVADVNNHRIQVFHPDGTFAFAFGSYGGGPGEFAAPVGVAIGPDGRIAVADADHRRIRVFHPDGTFAFAFGSYGVGQRQFISPVDVAIGPDGRIAVADPGKFDAQVFHPNGTFAFAIYRGGGPEPYLPDGIAFGPDGRIALTAYLHGYISLFHPNGTERPTAYGEIGTWYPFGDVVDVAIGPDGRTALVDTRNHAIAVSHPNGTFAFAFGSYGGGPGEFDSPSGVAVRHRAPPAVAPAPVIVVEPGGSPGGPYNFTAVGDAANLAINVVGLAGQGAQPPGGRGEITVTFPPSETDVVTSFASVSFPPGVTATHVPADGLLVLRTSDKVPADAQVQGGLAYDGSGRVALQRVVEVGGGPSRIIFDQPVRILLEGQGGGRAFYIDGAAGPGGGCVEFAGQADGRASCIDGTIGKIVPIDGACAADDAGRVHRQMGGSGECQMDSAGGGKVIYTYHLTLFGTALPENAVPPPATYTCAAGIGAVDLDMRAAPGEYSPAVRQALINAGSLPFAHVEIAASPWRAGPVAGTPQGATPASLPALIDGEGEGRAPDLSRSSATASLPPGATEVGEQGPGGEYAAIGNGATVARGLGGGDVAPLWFRLNLTPYGEIRGINLVQHITYQALCMQ